MQTKLVHAAAAALLWAIGHPAAQAACSYDSESGKYTYYNPSVSIGSPAAGATFGAPASFTVSVRASDSGAGDTSFLERLRLYRNGVEIAAQTWSGGTQTGVVNWNVPLTALAPGVHNLEAVARGACARSARASINVTVTALPPSPPPQNGNPIAGTLPGTAGVQAGAATYHLPISVPPGVAGMVPEVALHHDGGSANGIAGVGWTLSAGSSIHRCSPTIAQDGYFDSVRLGPADRLCLDGRRLLVQQAGAGTPGSAGFDAAYWSATAEYRPESDPATRIVRSGSGFRVQTRDGRVHDYGDTAETTREGLSAGTPVTHAWLLRHSQDRLGNAIDYSYTKNTATGEHLLSTIRWGANAAANQAAFAKLAFSYEPRPDADTRFIAGGRADQNQRLAQITTWTDTAADGSGGTQALQYRLSYELSPTSGRSLLATAQLCGADGACLPATRFQWGRPDPGVARTLVSKGTWSGPVLEDSGATTPVNPVIVPAPQLGHLPAELYTVADVDGDGLNDLVTRYPHGGTPITLYRNTGSGFVASNALPGVDATYFVADAADYDGDGQADLLIAQGAYDSYGYLQASLPDRGANLNQWQLCLSRLRQGQGFQCTPWAEAGQGPTAQRLFHDFDADGRQDVYFSDELIDGSTGVQRLCLSRDSGFVCATPSHPLRLGADEAEMRRPPWRGAGTTDVDGDGRLEQIEYALLVWDAEQRVLRPRWGALRTRSYAETGRGAGNSFEYGSSATYPTQAGGAAGDLNGDGYSDVALHMGPTPAAQTEWRRCLAPGQPGPFQCDAFTLSGPSMSVQEIADYDQDGQAEVLVHPSGDLTQFTPCTVRSGDGLRCTANWTAKEPPTPLLPNGEGPQSYQLDLSGNGLPERVDYRMGGQWEILAPAVLAYEGEALDRLVQVTDGLNRATRFEYARPGDAAVYSAAALDPDNRPIAHTYPLRRIPRQGALVRALKVSNGQGAWLETRYKYAGAARDLSGRGHAGYARIDATEVASGITRSTWFSQTWPTTGMQSATRQTSAAGVVLSATRAVLDRRQVSLPSGQVVQLPYVSQASAERRDLNGAAIDSSSTQDEIDDWGNATRSTQTVTAAGQGVTSTVTTTTITSYQNDPATWLIGLAQRSSTSKTRDGTTTTRTQAATHDTNGLPRTLTLEPDDAAYSVLTTYERGGNPYGLVTKATQTWRDPASGQTQTRSVQDVAAFESRGRFAETTRNALGHTSTQRYDPRFGMPVQHTTPNGVSTRWTLDGFGRVAAELTPQGTQERQALRGCDGSCPAWATHVAVTEHLKDGVAYAAATLNFLDDSARVLRSQSTGLNGQTLVTDQRYDSRGRLSEVDQPRFSDAAPVLASRTIYDDLDRPTITLSFDEAGTARSTQTTYDGLSRTVTNPKGQSQTSVQDALGQVARATDALGGVTTYAHDAWGNLTQVTDPKGNVVQIAYDRLGRRTDLRDPDLGWIHEDVDPPGRVWRRQSPKQRSAGTYSLTQYDALDRPISRSEPDLSSTWVYDSAANGLGQLAEAYTGPAAQKDYRRQHSYDSLGRPSSTTVTLDTTYTSTQEYDDKGRPSRETHQRAGGAIKTYERIYSTSGHLLRIERAGAVLWQAAEHDAAQRVTYSLLGNGLSQRHSYNPYSGRLTAATLNAGAEQARLSEGYSYDELGNMSQRSQAWDGSGYSESFSYDGLNRLSTAQVAGQALQSFTYDAIGNITSKTGVGTGRYVYPAAGALRPHAVQSIPGLGSYGYDDNGNLAIAPNGAVLSWKSWDMPDTLTRGGVWSQFGYGPEHQRGRQTRSDGTVLYYAGAMEAEVKAGVVTHKTYWPQGLGVEIDKAGATELLWTHTDRLGSVVGLTTSAGAWKEKLAYDAWGKRRTLDGSATPNTLDGVSDNKGFTGHEMLDNVDLVHMNGRIYEPTIARFVSADPVIQDPLHSQSYNRYSYVWNNPTNLTDPSGFEAQGDAHQAAQATNNAEERKQRLQRMHDGQGWAVMWANPEVYNGNATQGGATSNSREGQADTKAAGTFNGISPWGSDGVRLNANGLNGSAAAPAAAAGAPALTGGVDGSYIGNFLLGTAEAAVRGELAKFAEHQRDTFGPMGWMGRWVDANVDKPDTSTAQWKAAQYLLVVGTLVRNPVGAVKVVSREERWLQLANQENTRLPKEVVDHINRHGGKYVSERFGLELAHRPKRAAAQGYDYSEAIPKTAADHRGIQHRYLQERATGTTIRIPSRARGGGALDVPPPGALP